MPPHSRAQRRRQATRPQRQPNADRSAVSSQPAQVADLPDEPTDQLAPVMTTSTGAAAVRPAAPARSSGNAARRTRTRPAPEPVDYSKDYVHVRQDLRWIALWAGLLFVAMIALKFSGLV